MFTKCCVVLLFSLSIPTSFAKTAEAIFAGGCFWNMQADFAQVKGVLDIVAGYDGGNTPNPSYRQVLKEKTNYRQAVLIIYNPAQVTYSQLVEYFWHHIDPTMENGQFCDQGKPYQTAIFYTNKKQQQIALESKKRMNQKFSKITTKIISSTQFYAAGYEHQAYPQRHPLRYKYYRWRCGRDKGIQALWE